MLTGGSTPKYVYYTDRNARLVHFVLLTDLLTLPLHEERSL